MAASETEDSDILWCINHDSFPFKKPLMETQVCIEKHYRLIILDAKRQYSLIMIIITDWSTFYAIYCR